MLVAAFAGPAMISTTVDVYSHLLPKRAHEAARVRVVRGTDARSSTHTGGSEAVARRTTRGIDQSRNPCSVRLGIGAAGAAEGMTKTAPEVVATELAELEWVIGRALAASGEVGGRALRSISRERLRVAPAPRGLRPASEGIDHACVPQRILFTTNVVARAPTPLRDRPPNRPMSGARQLRCMAQGDGRAGVEGALAPATSSQRGT